MSRSRPWVTIEHFQQTRMREDEKEWDRAKKRRVGKGGGRGEWSWSKLWVKGEREEKWLWIKKKRRCYFIFHENYHFSTACMSRMAWPIFIFFGSNYSWRCLLSGYYVRFKIFLYFSTPIPSKKWTLMVWDKRLVVSFFLTWPKTLPRLLKKDMRKMTLE